MQTVEGITQEPDVGSVNGNCVVIIKYIFSLMVCMHLKQITLQLGFTGLKSNTSMKYSASALSDQKS